MVSPAVGSVVSVRFPFSDLTSTKLRPAVVLADVDRGDWILCQVTSNPYADTTAIELAESDFETGTLRRISYARPGKLFTANTSLIASEVGSPNAQSLTKIAKAVISLIEKAVSK